MKKSIIIDKIKEKKNEFITAKQRKLNESSNFYILDNGGETVDRYTLVTASGEIYGFSDNPYGAQGFGQYCGNLYDWREHSPEDYAKSMVGEGKDKLIQLSNLSPDAQKFVMERKDESFINKRKPMKESGNRIKEYDKVYWNYTDPNSGKVIPMNGIVQNIQGQKAYVESKSNYANRGFGVYLNQLSKTPLNEDTYDNPNTFDIADKIVAYIKSHPSIGIEDTINILGYKELPVQMKDFIKGKVKTWFMNQDGIQIKESWSIYDKDSGKKLKGPFDSKEEADKKFKEEGYKSDNSGIYEDQKESVKKSIKQEVVLKEDVMINGIIFESGEKLGILD